MAKHSANAPKPDSGGERSKNTPEGLIPVLILIGIALLIVLTGMNFYETHRQRTELNEQMTQLIAAVGTKANAPAARPTGPDPNKVYTVKTDGSPFAGRKGAPITIAEFSEFQWPFCAKVGPTLKQIKDVYKDNVQIVWKHMPLTNIHKNAMPAALAAEAAQNQGKFWEYHDKLFANQSKLGPDDLKQYAKDLGLDTARFENDLADPQKQKRVQDDMAEAKVLGVTGTPAFFVNGRFLNGAKPFEEFAKLINAELQRLNIPVPPEATAQAGAPTAPATQ